MFAMKFNIPLEKKLLYEINMKFHNKSKVRLYLS